jgi:hypothetical protein
VIMCGLARDVRPDAPPGRRRSRPATVANLTPTACCGVPDGPEYGRRAVDHRSAAAT